MLDVAFSPDGRWLAGAAHKSTDVWIWDTTTGAEFARLAGHMDQVLQIAFSPDGRTLASVSADRSVKLWHLPTRREVATLLVGAAHDSVAFTRDGPFLVVKLAERGFAILRAPRTGP